MTPNSVDSFLDGFQGKLYFRVRLFVGLNKEKKLDLTQWINKELNPVVSKLQKGIESGGLSYGKQGVHSHHQRLILDALDKLLSVLFPGTLGDESLEQTDLNLYLCDQLRWLAPNLSNQIEHFLIYESERLGSPRKECRPRAQKAAISLIQELPKIRKTLLKDIEAAYEGDPAAISLDEVLITYPCVDAIATHRIAHHLYKSGIPIVPRIMSERAHSRTGIDIHPGATIGPSFFIDHGTGVVIGETTVIGKSVKLYQGVTLGALSFPKDENGNPIKGIKRHPNIEDGVVIYAGATVLGGDTTIGKNSIIGGSCWVTHSVPPNTLVTMESQETKIKKKN